MKHRITDWTLSLLAGVVALALSWPFWRDFSYWAESPAMWWVYFIIGYPLAVYVFYVFIACTRMLFHHERLIQCGIIEQGETFDDVETEEATELKQNKEESK